MCSNSKGVLSAFKPASSQTLFSLDIVIREIAYILQYYRPILSGADI